MFSFPKKTSESQENVRFNPQAVEAVISRLSLKDVFHQGDISVGDDSLDNNEASGETANIISAKQEEIGLVLENADGELEWIERHIALYNNEIDAHQLSVLHELIEDVRGNLAEIRDRVFAIDLRNDQESLASVKAAHLQALRILANILRAERMFEGGKESD